MAKDTTGRAPTLIQNTFSKGMNQDALESLQPEGSYRFMLNGIHEGYNVTDSGVINEQSTKQVASFSGQIVGTQRIPNEDASLIFLAGSGSEIWIFDHNTYEKTHVVTDSEFGASWGFSTCEWLNSIEIKYMEPCSEMIVYWSSDCVYHLANVTALLDEKRRVQFEKEDFDLVNCECVPTLRSAKLNNGNDLQAGAYQFAAQLQDEDGNSTNWFNVGMPIYLKSKNNQPGERSTESVRIQVRDLSLEYNKVNIAVIKTINGSKSVFFLGSRTYNTNGITYDYYAQGQEERTMSLTEILTKRKTYILGKDLVQKDGRLYLYNIKQEKNLNYQKDANNITLGYQVYRVPWNFYKDNVEKFPSMMRDENYAFGIQAQYCDGTTSNVFHIPGPQGGVDNCECSEGVGASLTSQAFQTSQIPTTKAVRTTLFGPSTSTSDGCGPGEGKLPNGTCVPCSTLDCPSGQCGGAQGCGCTEGGLCVEQTDSGGSGGSGGTGGTGSDDKVDQYEDLLEGNVKDYNTPPTDIEDCAECAQSSIGGSQDHVGTDKTIGDYTDSVTDLYRQDGDPKATNGNITGSAQELTDQILNPKDIPPPEPVVPTLDNSKGNEADTPGGTPSIPIFDEKSCEIKDVTPVIYSEGSLGSYISCEKYPFTLDCEGEYIYGDLAGQPVRHHKTPTIEEEPHYVSYANGVISQNDPSNYEYRDTFVHVLGLKVSGITIPEDDDLPKPLCPNEPFKIVMVKREAHNKSVVAKGVFFGTFTGSTYGRTYYYPRHGVNSFENVDRHIEDEPGGSHIGNSGATNAYIFHSPDTNMRRVPLSSEYVQPELEFFGSGYRYGQYDEGKKVFNAFENQIDRRGARQGVNLNFHNPIGQDTICISGQSYAEADSVVTQGDGISYALNNAYRESSVIVELDGQLPSLSKGVSGHEDASFVGDGLDHDSQIEKAAAIYGALKRNNTCQYGSVESMRYIDTGLYLTKDQTSVSGPTGDTFIGPYSIKRTGYVSNKVGKSLDAGGGHELTKCNDVTTRDICDPINLPDSSAIKYAGFDDYTEAPKSGEVCDARNYTNMHPGKFADEAYGGKVTSPEEDYYFPATLTTLVHFWVETEVNITMRTKGDDILEEVYYNTLGTWEYDSAAPNKSNWEDSWLPQFRLEIRRPSKWQTAIKAFIRTVLGYLMPLYFATDVGQTDDPLELISKMFVAPFLIAMFTSLEKGTFGIGAIDKLIGMDECRMDESGGINDKFIEGFKDNYHDYNPDYQTLNELNLSIGMPSPYNTCECDDCDIFTTQEILFSDTQIINSQRDAYKNFKANNYLNIPAHAGRIMNMFILDSQFYVHSTDGIWTIQYKNGTVDISNSQQLLLGGNDLLLQPRKALEGVPGGYMGLNDPNSAEVTQLGYLFVDREARKLVRFSGQQGMVDMTLNGMRNFFRNELPFDSISPCTDERGSNYYTFGIDYRHNRIMFTKKDTNSWTLSYDYVRNAWISFHSYIPKGYLWDRGRMFSFTDSDIHIHNESPDDYQSFYGNYSPFILDYSAVGVPAITKEYTHSVFETEASYSNKGMLNVKNRKITFNKAIIANSFQSTGVLNLIPKDASNNDPSSSTREDYPNVSLQRESSQWRMNDIRDTVIDTSEPIWTQTPGAPWRIFNESNTKMTNQALQNNILFDKYVTNHLIFDNLEYNNVQLVVKFALTHFKMPVL